MPIWTKTITPHFAPHAVIGKDGWVHPVTNEVLETFGAHDKQTVVTTPTVVSVQLYQGFIAASGEVVPDKRTHFKTGDILTFAVQFNSQVKVSGVSYLSLSINGSPAHAVYEPASGFDIGESAASIPSGGSATLLFYYKVLFTDSAIAGQVSVSSPIVTASYVKSYLNNNSATLTFSAPSLSTLVIN
jgi:hypothetical protein